MNKAMVRKELKKLGIKTYRTEARGSFVRKSEVLRALAREGADLQGDWKADHPDVPNFEVYVCTLGDEILAVSSATNQEGSWMFVVTNQDDISDKMFGTKEEAMLAAEKAVHMAKP